ncbi:MAG: hypothetical protein DRQ61_11310 [Gammaproteobacteria bacterium]|nr:MAG: hypothetical protein DRQ61_11310 [Gammaproteobacteria bacterium]
MLLQKIEGNKYLVVAYVEEAADGDESIVALDDLRSLGQKYSGSIKGIISLFKIYAKYGRMQPDGVTQSHMHHANYEPDILEFIKGKVRVFCFVDKGGMVVLTNSGLKKGQKASSKDVSKAIKVFRKYHSAKLAGDIEFLEKE